MTEAVRWAEIERLYHEALGMDDSGRRVLLSQLADASIREEVESLLAHDTDAEDFLDRPALEAAAREFNASLESALEPGSLVGPYKIVRQVGRGGMGLVYEAEQQHPVRRTVALKMIKAGMDSESLVARFQAERQTLAMMDHPNIARVFDAGSTATGRPYFVMELVDGVAVTEYCSANRLTLREKLALFIPICRAIQHAHQKGVIHRDIKPSNLLVARYDSQPLAKVIDFGIAKATQEPLPGQTARRHTQVGTVIGTFDYMSPEQAGPDSWDIDTRSDVYSLGAVLYEVIAGVPPLDRAGMQTSSELELLRKIREVDPIAPSSRIADPKLASQVRGELDWVCMRALEKDRAQRYRSAGELGDDIEHFLKGETVHAAAPSTLYRWKRLAWRNRVPLATASAFLLVVLAGAAFSVREAIRARRAEQEASAVSEFLQNGLLAQVSANVQASSNVRPDPDLKVRTALDRAAQRIAGRFPQQPVVEAALRQTIGSTYLDLGLPKEAEEQLRRALNLRLAQLGQRSEVALESENLLAVALLRQDRVKEADALGRKVLEARTRSLGERHPATLTSLHNLAAIEQAQGRDVDAEARYRKVVELRTSVLRETHPDTLKSMNDYGYVLGRLERFKAATGLLRRVIQLRKQVLGDEHPDTMESKTSLARLYHDSNAIDLATPLLREVLPWQRRVLGASHPDSLRTQTLLGMSVASMGDFAEADAILSDCTAAAAKALGASHAIAGACRNNHANALNAAGQYARAEQLYRSLLQSDIEVRGPDAADTLRSMSNLAINLGLAGKHQEAQALFERVVAMRTRVLGEQHPKTLSSMDAHAQLLRRAGHLHEAERVYRRVVSLRHQVLGPDHGNTRYSKLSLAGTLVALGQFPEAAELLRTLAAHAEAEPWFEGIRQSLLGTALAGLKQFAEAEPMLRAGYTIVREQGKAMPLLSRPELRGEVERARQRLSRFYQEQGLRLPTELL